MLVSCHKWNAGTFIFFFKFLGSLGTAQANSPQACNDKQAVAKVTAAGGVVSQCVQERAAVDRKNSSQEAGSNTGDLIYVLFGYMYED